MIDIYTAKNDFASYDVVDEDDTIPSGTNTGQTRLTSQTATTLNNGTVQ